jgi:hypothetical protein
MLCVSFAQILGWISYSVKSFGFGNVQGELPPPLSLGNGERIRQPFGQFEQAGGFVANESQYMHIAQNWLSILLWCSPSVPGRAQWGQCFVRIRVIA